MSPVCAPIERLEPERQTERALSTATSTATISTASTATTDRPGIAATEASFQARARGDDRVLVLSGSWTMRHLGRVEAELRELAPAAGRTVIDMADVERLDTAGAWLLERFADRTGNVAVTNVAPEAASLMEAVQRYRTVGEGERAARANPFERMVASVGRSMFALGTDVRLGLNVLGAAIWGERSGKAGRRGFGITPVVAQLDKMAVQAVPIVGLMSFLIGAIVAQQGAFQLRYAAGAGTEIFAVDLVSILLLREIGVMLTAIMVAGRTGSAMTAELGSMRMREEIDALQVMGLNPMTTLIFPRLVALGIALPLLTIVSCFFALLGGALVLNIYADLSLTIQISRLQEAIDFTTIAAGIIKAPFMALIIGIVAALEGMQVGGSAESLGRRVTASVVKSIFLVIFVDGMFAVFYAAIDF